MAQSPRSKARRASEPVPPPLIGSFLLESITTGMYGERKNAIREYVQNSFDGIQSAVEADILRDGAGQVTLTISADKQNLVIFDNGIGVPHRIAVNTLTAVGASRKQRGRRAGFRGIGRLAGIAFSRILRFRTKAAGDELETTVEFDCEALRHGMLSTGRKPAADLIGACATFEQRRARDPEKHFFEVSLLGLKNAPAEAIDPLQMRNFLSQVAPVDFHPDFDEFRTKIFEGADALEVPDLPDQEYDSNDSLEEDVADWSVLSDDSDSMLERIPVPCVAVVIKSGDSAREEPVYKPYRPKLGVDKGDSAPLTDIKVYKGSSGAWWGWIGYKAKPGEYEDNALSGIRFRLKNIQIDGSELITLVPTSNSVRDPFNRWSNWFLGEIHVDPRAVVPNARRDNFEEDARWLAIREEISEICGLLTSKARSVSKAHQTSLEVLDKKAQKLRSEYASVVRTKTFDGPSVRKILTDSDRLQKDIEKASSGAPVTEQIRLKAMVKELAQIRVNLLEKPAAPEYDQFRATIRREYLEKTLSILNDYLEIDLYEEIKEALERELR